MLNLNMLTFQNLVIEMIRPLSGLEIGQKRQKKLLGSDVAKSTESHFFLFLEK